MSRNTGDHEGPALITVSHESCLGCKWHEIIMVESGLCPIYYYYCNHPKSMLVHKSLVDPRSAWIGEDDHTPNWCPVKLAAQEAATPPTVGDQP